ncbi:FtsX-like permease family protein, partial [Candidatus Parcubacteria bacterium]|nr:FtsX-like permease family protein [Candidatus Parcubacteria bacterium]
METFKMALEALVSNKLRSLLSILGIIIGVSTVIVVVGIGTGAKMQIEEQYKNLSATQIMVMESMGRSAITKSKLDLDDVEVIRQKVEHVGDTTAFVTGNTSVSYEKESSSFSLFGTHDNFFSITNLDLETGRFLTLEENEKRARVGVVGAGLIETLFGEDVDVEELIGKSVTLSGKKIEIVGVLNKNGGSAMGKMSYDDAIYIPYSTAEKTILGESAQITISVLMESVDYVKTGVEDITAVLRVEHKLSSTQNDDFRIFDPGSIVGAAQDSANTMSLLLIAVATIVLIVSGVGIMNVMFVTVAERTKEIGIAKAIGAKQEDVLSQFLLESIILSVGGGLVGVVVGQIAIPILNHFEGWYVLPSFFGVILSFTFSALVGLFFGIYPAFKASRLDPVDA